MTLPNQLTIARIVLTPVYLYFFLSDSPLMKQISIGIFIVAALTDWYDGWLARKFNYITNWGKFWDPLADKILTSAAFLGFVFLGVLQLWMVIIIMVRDFVITLLRAFSDYKGHSFPTSQYAKVKTFIQMGFLYYLLLIYTGKYTYQVSHGHESLFNTLLYGNYVYILMLAITLITFHSGFTYIYKNRRLILRLFNIEN